MDAHFHKTLLLRPLEHGLIKVGLKDFWKDGNDIKAKHHSNDSILNKTKPRIRGTGLFLTRRKISLSVNTRTYFSSSTTDSTSCAEAAVGRRSSRMRGAGPRPPSGSSIFRFTRALRRSPTIRNRVRIDFAVPPLRPMTSPISSR